MVRLLPAPPSEITPPVISVFARAVIVGEPDMSILLTPKLRLFVPMKPKLPAQVRGLPPSVRPPAEASIAPPLMTKVFVPLPRAALLPIDRVPSFSVIVLLVPKELSPVRMRTPLPAFVRLPAPEMIPESVSAPVLTPRPGPAVVIVRSAASVTAPGKVSAALPPKLISAPRVITPAVVPVIAAPEVLLIVPPLRATVAEAAPRAAAELTFTVPALRTN